MSETPPNNQSKEGASLLGRYGRNESIEEILDVRDSYYSIQST